MDLVEEFVLRADIGERIVPGAGPLGARAVAGVSGGTVTGERINGRLVGPGADWALARPDGFIEVDVRLQIVTDDDAALYLTYVGLLEMNEAARRAIAPGNRSEFGDHYFRTTPRLETGDERYAWVNRTLFVGRGRLLESGVEYEVFRVT